MREASPDNWLPPFLVAPLLGPISLALPPLMLDQKYAQAAAGSLLRTGAEHMSWLTLLLFLISGAILGGCFRSAGAWVSAFVVMAAMPLVTLTDLMADSTSHNLWPLEFVAYGALTVVALMGAGLGVLVRRRL